MKIAIGSDHAGFELKEEIKKHLSRKRTDYKDFGTYNEESCDYSDYAEKVGAAVASGKYDLGVLVCGAGIGMSIAANKVRGIYAALVDNTYSAEMAKMHNNANVLVMPGRLIGKELGKQILEIFMEKEYEGGRHEKRLSKVRDVEAKNFK